MECEQNFVLSFDKKYCENFKDSNCLLSTSLKCASCKDGYIRDNNYFLNNMRYKAQTQSSILTAMDMLKNSQVFS